MKDALIGLVLGLAIFSGITALLFHEPGKIDPPALTVHTYLVKGEKVDVECHALMGDSVVLKMECNYVYPEEEDE